MTRLQEQQQARRVEAEKLAGELIDAHTTPGTANPSRCLPEAEMTRLISTARYYLSQQGFLLRSRRQTPHEHVGGPGGVTYEFWIIEKEDQ